MYENYTEKAHNQYMDLMDQGLYHIWDDIENTPEDTSADMWRKKILGIARKYNLSSRFALMRILYCRCTGLIDLSISSPVEGVSFSMEIGNKTVEFSDVSIQHAMQLTKEELAQYKTALLKVAAAQKYPDYKEQVAEKLISIALQIPDDSSDAPKKMNRENAIKLGHVLGFSVSEMNWFLLRVFQTDNGLMLRSSDDLIDYYCFETKKNYTSASNLKREYARRTEVIETEEADEYAQSWTQNLSNNFSEKIREWNAVGAQADELFLQWMVEHAHFLDRLSRTALCVYKNLSLYAFHIAIGQEEVLEEKELFDRLEKEINSEDPGEWQDLLQSEGERIRKIGNNLNFESGLMEIFKDTILKLEPDELLDVIDSHSELKEHFEKLVRNLTPDKQRDAINDEKKILFKKIFMDLNPETLCDVIVGMLTPELLCDVIANTLTLENSLLTFTDVKDKYREKAWGAISVNSNKTPSRSQSNLKKVLMGETSPQKDDVLYLLWFLLNRSWTLPASSEAVPGKRRDILPPKTIFNRMADFMDISKDTLEAALLPAFYPPHLMEQSMMLTIAATSDNAIRTPAETYEEICKSLIVPRKKADEPPDKPAAPDPLPKKHSDPHAKPLTKKEKEKKKMSVVEDYLQNQKTQTLKVCAEKNGISVQTLINWKNKYLKAQGK